VLLLYENVVGTTKKIRIKPKLSIFLIVLIKFIP